MYIVHSYVNSGRDVTLFANLLQLCTKFVETAETSEMLLWRFLLY